MKIRFLHVLVLAGILSCETVSHAQFLFDDGTAAAGIFMRSSGVAEAGPGVVVFDLNGDGWDDIYMSGGFDSDKIYVNMHDGTFKDQTPENISTHTGAAQQPFHIYPRGGIAFDYDNDGNIDIYSVCQQHDVLWHNNGDGTFSDATKTAHLDFPLDQNESMSATFGDFDGDGDNDFYVARWVNEWKYREDLFGHKIGYAHKGFPNYFYVNNGDGTFAEKAVEFKVDGDTGTTNIAMLFDYDRDGDLDLIIGNDFGTELTPNMVWKNMLMETGTATFVDVSHESGLQCHLGCMGIGPCDFNRDGEFDFLETTFGPDSLMMNLGHGKFKDVSKAMMPIGDGYERSGSGLTTTTWTALMGDYDNDAWQDAFIVHGYLSLPTLWNSITSDTTEFYRNVNGHYENVTPTTMNGRFLSFKGRGAAYLDFNHDGKLDICVGSLETDPSSLNSDFVLLKNISTTPISSAHWLELRFVAKRTAKEAIGTIVDVWAGGIRGSRQVSTGGGFGSQNSLMQHIGMGTYAKADSIIVYWPADKNRHRQIDRYYDVQADNFYTYTENVSAVAEPVTTRGMSLRISPNPAFDVLHLTDLDPSVETHFGIFSMLGVLLVDAVGRSVEVTLELQSLKPAPYVLRITERGETKYFSFVKL
ncbi:MAG: FG-GAP-like repeat-containing protein [bacterium]